MQTRVEIHYRQPRTDQGHAYEQGTYLTGVLHDDGSVKVESTFRTTDSIPAGTSQRPANWPAHLTHVEIVLLDPEERPAMMPALAKWASIASVATASGRICAWCQTEHGFASGPWAVQWYENEWIIIEDRPDLGYDISYPLRATDHADTETALAEADLFVRCLCQGGDYYAADRR